MLPVTEWRSRKESKMICLQLLRLRRGLGQTHGERVGVYGYDYVPLSPLRKLKCTTTTTNSLLQRMNIPHISINYYTHIPNTATLVISTSIISNNHFSRRENLVLVLTQKSNITNKILWIRGEIAPEKQFLPVSTIFSIDISH